MLVYKGFNVFAVVSMDKKAELPIVSAIVLAHQMTQTRPTGKFAVVSKEIQSTPLEFPLYKTL